MRIQTDGSLITQILSFFVSLVKYCT